MDSFVLVATSVIAGTSLAGVLTVRAALRKGDLQAEARTRALVRTLEAEAESAPPDAGTGRTEPAGVSVK